MEITAIPTNELLADLEETIVDIVICRRAFLCGILEHNGIRITDRFTDNRKIRATIEAELSRRQVPSPWVKPDQLEAAIAKATGGDQ